EEYLRDISSQVARSSSNSSTLNRIQTRCNRPHGASAHQRTQAHCGRTRGRNHVPRDLGHGQSSTLLFTCTNQGPSTQTCLAYSRHKEQIEW
ncbi:unnamed protein product, partial [Cylicocyclus nassatus]